MIKEAILKSVLILLMRSRRPLLPPTTTESFTYLLHRQITEECDITLRSTADACWEFFFLLNSALRAAARLLRAIFYCGNFNSLLLLWVTTKVRLRH